MVGGLPPESKSVLVVNQRRLRRIVLPPELGLEVRSGEEHAAAILLFDADDKLGANRRGGRDVAVLR